MRGSVECFYKFRNQLGWDLPIRTICTNLILAHSITINQIYHVFQTDVHLSLCNTEMLTNANDTRSSLSQYFFITSQSKKGDAATNNELDISYDNKLFVV